MEPPIDLSRTWHEFCEPLHVPRNQGACPTHGVLSFGDPRSTHSRNAGRFAGAAPGQSASRGFSPLPANTCVQAIGLGARMRDDLICCPQRQCLRDSGRMQHTRRHKYAGIGDVKVWRFVAAAEAVHNRGFGIFAHPRGTHRVKARLGLERRATDFNCARRFKHFHRALDPEFEYPPAIE